MADDVTTNILEHEAEFRRLIDAFDFTSPGKDASLGKDLAVAVANGIVERTTVDQLGSSGSPLKALSTAYKARKVKDHGVGLIGVRTGQMLSLESVLGDVTITADEVTLAYGTGEAPTKFATHGDLKPNEPTDREKADWFGSGGREFYAIDEAIAEAAAELAREALQDYLAENG